MALKSEILDPETGISPAVDDTGGERRGLVVATRDLKTYTSAVEFFHNPEQGFDMNVNAAYSGSPVWIHNGLDNVYWTASAITGVPRWVFNAVAPGPGHGTQSIDATTTINNDEAQFVRPAGAINFANYIALTGFIWLTGWPAQGTKEVELYGWDTSTGLQVGDAVGLSDYIDVGSFGAWQKFAIPLFDFGALSTVTTDAIRVKTVDVGPGAPSDYYLDDMRLEQSGSPVIYTVKPEKGTWLYCQNIRFALAAEYEGTFSQEYGTMPRLAYDDLLGVSITNGIVYQRVQNENVQLSVTIRQLSDFLQRPTVYLDNAIDDGTNVMITLRGAFQHPEVLRSEDEDELRIIIQDDLSGFLLFRASVGGRVEVRE